MDDFILFARNVEGKDWYMCTRCGTKHRGKPDVCSVCGSKQPASQELINAINILQNARGN